MLLASSIMKLYVIKSSLLLEKSTVTCYNSTNFFKYSLLLGDSPKIE